LARQARVQGDVLLDAILDTDGRIAEVSVVSGHPLLIPAALECVKSWRFEPTYLNDEPVAVKMIITVSFRIG
jgi:protein TonB